MSLTAYNSMQGRPFTYAWKVRTLCGEFGEIMLNFKNEKKNAKEIRFMPEKIFLAELKFQ